jgi:DNA-binding response OmpR family regulator
MKDARIYIVEDDYVVAKNLSLLLENLGYKVQGISDSGEDALLQIKKKGPTCWSLILTLPAA